MSKIDYQALREAAEKAGEDKWQAKKINGDFFVIRHGSYTRQHGYTSYQPIAEIDCKPVRDFVAKANPATVLALLDDLEAQSKRIAELEKKAAPDSFGIIGENIRTQDNRITSDPMFCVYQKREIVVDADYDYDRIVWVDEDGNEANKRQSRRLELLHENFREPPEKWRRVAVKDIDEFVTCCFTEQGCKDYLAVNGHNLRLPFIYVKSGFRNAEYIGIRNWLAGIRIKGE